MIITCAFSQFELIRTLYLPNNLSFIHYVALVSLALHSSPSPPTNTYSIFSTFSQFIYEISLPETTLNSSLYPLQDTYSNLFHSSMLMHDVSLPYHNHYSDLHSPYRKKFLKPLPQSPTFIYDVTLLQITLKSSPTPPTDTQTFSTVLRIHPRCITGINHSKRLILSSHTYSMILKPCSQSPTFTRDV